MVSALSLSALTAEAAELAHFTVEGDGGVPLHAMASGPEEAPGVVLMHGFGFSAETWRPLMTGPLAERYRLVAFDLRGHGASGKPWSADAYSDPAIWARDVQAVIDAAGLDGPVLVGWSFGAFVAVKYVREMGAEAIDGLVTVGSLAGLVERPPPPSAEQVAELDAPPPRGDGRVDDFTALYPNLQWIASVMTVAPKSAAELQRDVVILAQTPPYAKRAMLDMQLDARDVAPVLDAPVLFLYGEKDLQIPTSSVEAAMAILPDARRISYPNVGHSPFHEVPVQFTDDLGRFLDEVTAE